MAPDEAAKVARVWEVTFEDRDSPMTQTMPITQDGACNQETHHDALGTRHLRDPSRGTISASRSRGKLGWATCR
jgi:hypothetical protein